MPSLLAPTKGLTLARRRKDLGLTQTDVAIACGTTQKTVSAWERGEHLPTKLGHRQDYAACLQWGVSQLDESIQLTASLASTRNPGWMCLPRLTAISDVARRTLVPILPRPLASTA